MTQSLRIPITNVYAKGDFTMPVKLGSEEIPLQLILDTGSSTLAIHPLNYQPHQDTSLTPSSYAQDVTYGIGGWTGPVVYSDLHFEDENETKTVKQVPMALATVAQPHAFAEADGFFGLAYHNLNKAFDLSGYFKEHNTQPAVTWPWSFSLRPNHQAIQDFKKFLWKYPEQDITPCFTYLEQHSITKNKFAFYTRRSSIHFATDDASLISLKNDPLNQGWFILGGGEEQTDLFDGDFQNVEVLHDVYYNTHLFGIQLEGGNFIEAPPLDQKDEHLYFTNSIMDTGASVLLLAHDLYQQLLASFDTLNPEFKSIIQSVPPFEGEETGIPANNINLKDWPDLHFFFQAPNGSKTQLTCKPEHYWQINAPHFEQASLKIWNQLPEWPNQSIIGLPLFNGYFTVFDRSVSSSGILKFAIAKNP